MIVTIKKYISLVGVSVTECPHHYLITIAAYLIDNSALRTRNVQFSIIQGVQK